MAKKQILYQFEYLIFTEKKVKTTFSLLLTSTLLNRQRKRIIHFIKTNLLSDFVSQINSPHEMVINEINTDISSINT